MVVRSGEGCHSPVVKNECGLWEGLKRVLGLWCGWGLVLLLVILWLLLLLLWLGLGLLLLLWWGVCNGLLDQGGLAGNGGEDLLVGDSLEPAGGVGVLGAELLVEDGGEATGGNAGGVEVGEGEALTDEVGVDEEVVLEDAKALGGALLGVVDVLLVVGVLADERTEPASEGGEELGGGEGSPLEDGSVVLLGLAEEGRLLVLRGDYKTPVRWDWGQSLLAV